LAAFEVITEAQIKSGTSVILKLQEECGELIVIFEPHPSNCFPFQFRVFDAFMTHGVNPSGGKETVLGAILTAQDAYIPLTSTVSKSPFLYSGTLPR
jgi:hypothetical protein